MLLRYTYLLVNLGAILIPMEEVLFFFCIPYACVFLYEGIRYFKSRTAGCGRLYGIKRQGSSVPVYWAFRSKIRLPYAVITF